MTEQYEYLKDEDFLKTIDNLSIKEHYIKITALNWEEEPVKNFEGIVINGNIQLDGDSVIRRSCNLTFLLNPDLYNDFFQIQHFLAINTKIQIEIGILNTTNKYEKHSIIWIPLGVYVIINPSFSHGVEGTTVSMQLKDKMCLLNGECGGVIPAMTVFHELEELTSDGNYIIRKPTIYQIIKELVNHFGQEQLGKIFINDISNRVKEVIKWVGTYPIYLYQENEESTIQYLLSKKSRRSMDYSSQYYEPKKKIEAGEDIGFVYTDFTFPGELIAQPGQSVCDILEIIKNTLGNYEYFYDIEGNFIFQQKRNYVNISEATSEINQMKSPNYYYGNNYNSLYVFDNNNLITSYSNTPQYNLIKNDFIVWGQKKDVLGNIYPIRYHLAIDKKPNIGNEYEVYLIKTKDNLVQAKYPIRYKSILDLPKKGNPLQIYLIKEKNISKVYCWNNELQKYEEQDNKFLKIIKTKDWRTELYLKGTVAEAQGLYTNNYYTELKNEWPKIYNLQNEQLENIDNTSLDFFLDLIDFKENFQDISVNAIGRRSQVVNDDKINCLFEPSIPDFVILNNGDNNIKQLRLECEKKHQNYIQVDNNMFTNFSQGGHLNSAYNLIKELLYEGTNYHESISLQCLPIYYLEPNTRIKVTDIESGINGKYFIKNISLPLDCNGTMSITAVKELENF